MFNKVSIISAELDERSFAVLNQLRRAHFAPGRNYVDAHLTLFHHLPLELVLKTELLIPKEPIDVQLTRPFFMGAGTAIEVESEKLRELRTQLANTFSSHLTAQDRRLKRFHVTVQNKVDPKNAKQFFEQFKSVWVPMEGKVTGLLFWEYLGGPWKLVKSEKFI